MPSGFFGGAGIGPQAIGRSGAPPDPVPVAGADVVLKGTFDNAADWATGAGASIGSGIVAFDGTQSASSAYRGGVLTVGVWYHSVFDLLTRTAGTFGIGLGANFTVIYAAPQTAAIIAGRCRTNQTITLYAENNAAGTCDNLLAYPLTLSSLLSARTYASADCDLSAAITRTAGTQAGLCARLDSSTSPANFIIAYLDGAGNVKVDKCVAGVYTNVISGAVTYGSTKILRLVCSGNNVSAYYDGTQVGSTVTVSDAGIVSNTRHGKFSTYASNTFAGYVAA